MPDGGKACPAGEERAEGSALSMRQAAESIPRARLNRARSRVSTTFDISRSATWDSSINQVQTLGQDSEMKQRGKTLSHKTGQL